MTRLVSTRLASGRRIAVMSVGALYLHVVLCSLGGIFAGINLAALHLLAQGFEAVTNRLRFPFKYHSALQFLRNSPQATALSTSIPIKKVKCQKAGVTRQLPKPFSEYDKVRGGMR